MSELRPDEDNDIEYSKRVGDRLRSIRRQKRMSLLDVEAASDKEFKASVLGAYERAERAISVPRLQRLASHYSVPVAQLLPSTEEEQEEQQTPGHPFSPQNRQAVTIDLEKLRALEGSEAELMSRYLRGIQVQRQDFNGKVLTIRSDDLRALACMLGVPTDSVVSELEQLGLAYRRGH